MVLANLANTCSHIQNATRARLGLTSLPNNKFNLRLALAMHRAGLISSVTRGGPTPPAPETLLTAVPEPVTTANVATRRLWLGLKYWNNEPVVRSVKCISKPSRSIRLDLAGLEKIVRGFDAHYVKGLNMGECMFLSTDRGVLEVREAITKKVGGMVLCRASP